MSDFRQSEFLTYSNRAKCNVNIISVSGSKSVRSLHFNYICPTTFHRYVMFIAAVMGDVMHTQCTPTVKSCQRFAWVEASFKWNNGSQYGVYIENIRTQICMLCKRQRSVIKLRYTTLNVWQKRIRCYYKSIAWHSMLFSCVGSFSHSVCMQVCVCAVCVCVCVWMDGRMDGCMHACMHVWYVCTDGRADGRMDGRMHGCHERFRILPGWNQNYMYQRGQLLVNMAAIPSSAIKCSDV